MKWKEFIELHTNLNPVEKSPASSGQGRMYMKNQEKTTRMLS